MMALYKVRRSISLIKKDPDFRSFLAFAMRFPYKTVSGMRRSRQGRWIADATATDAARLLHARIPDLPLCWDSSKSGLLKAFDMRLASRTEANVCPDALPWNVQYDDMEDRAALHRFAWLLPLLLSWRKCGIGKAEAAEAIYKTILSWTVANSFPISGDEAWQPYTISERMMNWVLGCMATGRLDDFRKRFSETIQMQVLHLANNLEYYGNAFTGNHFSNNGRALYVIGLIYEKVDWMMMGKEILLKERARLFDEKYFLREGSSHYQYLITRNYCEALWFAQRYEDTETSKELSQKLADLSKGCQFFMVRGPDNKLSIPLIGDISPDCAPEWLLGVPWVCAHLTGCTPPQGDIPDVGWHLFFLPSFADGQSSKLTSKIISLKSSEWGKVDGNGWTVFGHVNPRGYPIIPGHAHQDTGGIVVYFNGVPVLVDCGRKEYVDSQEGQRGVDCWGHTIAVVDDRNPALYYRRCYPDKYLHDKAGGINCIDSEDGQMIIRHSGFKRVKDVGEYARRVYLQDRSLEIKDSVQGRGKHKIALVFHIPWDVFRHDKQNILGFKGGGFIFEMHTSSSLRGIEHWSGISPDKRVGWFSRCYGEEAPLSTIVCSGTVTLPWEGVTLIKVKEQ